MEVKIIASNFAVLKTCFGNDKVSRKYLNIFAIIKNYKDKNRPAQILKNIDTFLCYMLHDEG